MGRRQPRIMLVAPSFHPWDLGHYLHTELCERGIEGTIFPYRSFPSRSETNRELTAAVRKLRPDLLLGLKLGRIDPESLASIRRAGTRVGLWYVDCFDATVPRQIARLLPECDLFLTNAYGMIEKYRLHTDAPIYWVHEGVHLPAFRPTPVPSAQRGIYNSEVAFVGNVLHPPVSDRRLAQRRLRLLRRVAASFDLKIWGPQGDSSIHRRWRKTGAPLIEWPAYNGELVKIAHSARVVLGLNTVNTVERYFSNRTFLTLAAGGFHLTHYVPGLEAMFRNHEHLVWFSNDDECLKLLDYYLRRGRHRRRIAEAGRRWTRSRYSMRRQVGRIFRILEKHDVW